LSPFLFPVASRIIFVFLHGLEVVGEGKCDTAKYLKLLSKESFLTKRNEMQLNSEQVYLCDLSLHMVICELT
jgi:hypothetical protein